MAYIELTESNFNEVIENNETIIIDFWAEWCGPCKQFGPVFEKVAEANSDITFAKVNTEEQQALAQQFQIQSIPTVMIIKEKTLLFNQGGAFGEADFSNLVKQVKEIDMDQVRAEVEAEQAKQG